MEEQIYKEVIENLRLALLNKFGSIRKYCLQSGRGYSNLSRIFNGKQDISVQLFMSISADVRSNGVLPEGGKLESVLSLREFLAIDYVKVIKQILHIQSL